MKIKSFAIALGENNQPYTISRLIRHAMNSLCEDHEQSKIHIDDLYLLKPYVIDDTMESIWLSYTLHSVSAKQRYANVLESRNEDTWAPKIDAIHTIPELSIKAVLRKLCFCLPQNATQYDSVLLMLKLADYLEDQNIPKVEDLIYHDYLDEDAIPHPYVNVYYKS